MKGIMFGCQFSFIHKITRKLLCVRVSLIVGDYEIIPIMQDDIILTNISFDEIIDIITNSQQYSIRINTHKYGTLYYNFSNEVNMRLFRDVLKNAIENSGRSTQVFKCVKD